MKRNNIFSWRWYMKAAYIGGNQAAKQCSAVFLGNLARNPASALIVDLVAAMKMKKYERIKAKNNHRNENGSVTAEENMENQSKSRSSRENGEEENGTRDGVKRVINRVAKYRKMASSKLGDMAANARGNVASKGAGARRNGASSAQSSEDGGSTILSHHRK